MITQKCTTDGIELIRFVQTSDTDKQDFLYEMAEQEALESGGIEYD